MRTTYLKIEKASPHVCRPQTLHCIRRHGKLGFRGLIHPADRFFIHYRCKNSCISSQRHGRRRPRWHQVFPLFSPPRYYAYAGSRALSGVVTDRTSAAGGWGSSNKDLRRMWSPHAHLNTFTSNLLRFWSMEWGQCRTLRRMTLSLTGLI